MDGVWLFGEGLSGEARSVWAKHDRRSDGWLPLWRHLADSGAIAGRLWDEWVPEQVRRLIGEALPEGMTDARKLLVWLACVHDVGKATPAFACQVEDLAEGMRRAGLEMPLLKRMADRKLAPHGLAGQQIIQEWLVERHGWRRSQALSFVIVTGGHHGVPPGHVDIRELAVRPELLRTPGYEERWQRVQWEFLDRAADVCGVADRLAEWRRVKLPQPVQALLMGLVIVADWIASNSDLFPYFPEGQGKSSTERVEAAWKGLDLPRPWRAGQPEKDAGEFFTRRFPLPPGAKMRPVQERAIQAALEMSGPGLMIIEAPMGEGKTEAALAVAEIFASRSGSGGCLIALPTMATGNAMFPRMLRWLHRATAGEGHSVQLAHSKAALNNDYVELVRAGRRTIQAVDQDGEESAWSHRSDHLAASAELAAHQWMSGRKKGMLSSFVVGTIDQLLFMGLKSRHLALRHLAIAGKVVVIDEAHAYDTYMNAYLDRVLSWLGAYQVPVIVLSATLPARRRRELAQAYRGSDTEFTEVEEAEGYPLLTVVGLASPPLTRETEASGRGTEVHLERLDDGLDVLADRLELELDAGGCALVVRNTVGRVTETAAVLRERFGAENVTVAHAQFLDLDRADKDAELLRLFGPPNPDSMKRPAGPHVVVASQVAEQSLDIDFDLLVSDLCPIDLLLQRIGRLHRHPRGKGQKDRPERLRTARCLVTGADWDAMPVEAVTGSQKVYRRHALLRAAAVLEPYLSAPGKTLRLPEDISPLVQSAYGGEPVGPEEWQEAISAAADAESLYQSGQRQKAETFQLGDVGKDGRALIGWIEAGAGDADDTRAGRAQVRDSRESLEVLVVQRRADGTLTTVPWLSRGRGGLELPEETAPDPELARTVAACGLRLPFYFSIPRVLDQAIDELEELCIPAWQTKESPWLAGELILFLDEKGQSRLAGCDLSYSKSTGLEVMRDRPVV